MDAQPKTPESNDAHGSGVAPVTTAQRVAIARDMLHLTLNDAAKKIGASPSLVSLWESGQRNISLKHLMNICRAYGVSLDWLLGAQTIPRWPLPLSKKRRTKC